MSTPNTIPDGYRRDAQGRLVPVEQIKEVDLVRDELIHELVSAARDLQARLQAFRQRALGDIHAFVQLSCEKYDAKIGGTKGNIQLTSFSGQYKILIAVAETLVFDERLQAAKELIDQCFREWTATGPTEIRTIINDAFQVDAAGRINTKRILSLRRLNIEHPVWQQAMDAISDSLSVAASKTYIRIYERPEGSDQYQQITLDLSNA